MSGLLEVGLTNALLATAMAIGVYGVTRIWRNPYASHILWLLVLLKLITPPLFRLPIPTGGIGRLPTIASLDATMDAISSGRDTTRDEEKTIATVEMVVQEPDFATAIPATSPALAETATPAPWRTPIWPVVVASCWMGGSVLWAAVLVVRVRRFSRYLRRAQMNSPELQAAAQELAGRFGLGRCPRVYEVEGRIPPMVWAAGLRPRLLFPASLVRDLDKEQTDMLIAHELAHVGRGDPWIRWLEVVATGIFWWLPTAWWASQHIRRSAEHCCDARVLLMIPNRAKRYAQTLIQTVDFLSTGSFQPVATSNFARAGSLHGRIEMMLTQKWGNLAPVTRCALAALAMGILPVSAYIPSARGDQQSPSTTPEQSPDPSSGRGDNFYFDELVQNALVTVLGDGRLTHWGSVRWLGCPDRESIVSFGNDGALMQWDRATGVVRRGFYDVAAAAYVEKLNHVVFLDGTRRLQRWSLIDDSIQEEPFHAPARWRGYLFASPDGKYLARLDTAGSAAIWSRAQQKVVQELPVREINGQLYRGVLSAVAFTPDSQLVLLGGPERINVYELETGKLKGFFDNLKEEDGSHAGVYILTFSSDGKRLFMSDVSGRVHVLAWPDLEIIREFKMGHGMVHDAVLVGDQQLLTAGHEVWRTSFEEESEEVFASVLFAERASAIASATGGVLASVKQGRIEETQRQLTRRLRGGLRNDCTCFAFSPSGDQIALAGRSGEVVIRETVNWRRVASWRAHDAWVRHLVWSPTDDILLSKADDYSLIAWDSRRGKELHTFATSQHARAKAPVFSRDGRRLAVYMWPGAHEVGVYDPRTFQLERSIPRQALDLRGNFVLSADRKSLFSGGNGETVEQWSFGENSVIRTMGDYTTTDVHLEIDAHESVVFALSNRRLFAFDIVTGETLWAVVAHRAIGTHIARHPLLPLLATCGRDGTVALFDSRKGTLLRKLRLGPTRGHVLQVGFSPDGELLAAALNNGTVPVLRVSEITPQL